MRAARITASPRLQRVAALLADGRPYTTLDIVQGAGVCAVNSAIAELRWNGYSIECQRSGDLWIYRLLSAPTPKQPTEVLP